MEVQYRARQTTINYNLQSTRYTKVRNQACVVHQAILTGLTRN